MKRVKSKLVTYFLSFIPGAGFMYDWFMKRGISYLTVFLSSLVVVQWIGIDALMIIPVLVWFYAFFDQINTFSLAKEEQQEMVDEYIFHKYSKHLTKEFFKKYQHVLGNLFIAFGIYGMVHGAYCSVLMVLPEWLRAIAFDMITYVPRIIVSCMILFIGVKMLGGRLPKLWSLHRKEEPMKREDKLLTSNVVYYMDKGSKSLENENPVSGNLENEIKDEQSILEQVSREQLLRRAKDLLQEDIYQAIHTNKTTSATIETKRNDGND